jgi:hypothetical protein
MSALRLGYDVILGVMNEPDPWDPGNPQGSGVFRECPISV